MTSTDDIMCRIKTNGKPKAGQGGVSVQRQGSVGQVLVPNEQFDQKSCSELQQKKCFNSLLEGHETWFFMPTRRKRMRLSLRNQKVGYGLPEDIFRNKSFPDNELLTQQVCSRGMRIRMAFWGDVLILWRLWLRRPRLWRFVSLSSIF